MNPDKLNLIFLIGSFIAILSNCIQTYKDKGTKGISLYNVSFFSLMSLYQIYFLSFIGQIWSFYGSILVAFIQCYWLGMIVWYKIPKQSMNIDRKYKYPPGFEVKRTKYIWYDQIEDEWKCKINEQDNNNF